MHDISRVDLEFVQRKVGYVEVILNLDNEFWRFVENASD